MKRRLSNGWLATIIIVAAIAIDQAIKIWVKTHFCYGEELRVASWMRILFIENNGMAFGMELGSKFFLTWFRIIAVALLMYYLFRIRHSEHLPKGYVACFALITAGALGNTLDCIFYGVVFDQSTYTHVAQFLPPGGGYESLFHGRVVDMFYFPLCEWDWPHWMPGVGGEHFVFFQPIFNFADACLSVSVLALILFYSKRLAPEEKGKGSPTKSPRDTELPDR